jgi:hypothetical protein
MLTQHVTYGKNTIRNATAHARVGPCGPTLHGIVGFHVVSHQAYQH